MHILIFFFVTLPLIYFAFEIWIAMPFRMAADGAVFPALIYVVIMWGVPFLLITSLGH